MRLETMPLNVHRAGFLVESRALADDVVAVVQIGCGIREQGAEPLLARDQRPWPQILAVEV
jgi:hypothetical protein